MFSTPNAKDGKLSLPIFILQKKKNRLSNLFLFELIDDKQ